MAVVLTLVQTKQIRLNTHKQNNRKHSKYKYTYYQNTHTYTRPKVIKISIHLHDYYKRRIVNVLLLDSFTQCELCTKYLN